MNPAFSFRLLFNPRLRQRLALHVQQLANSIRNGDELLRTRIAAAAATRRPLSRRHSK
jgi:hypothetical protein